MANYGGDHGPIRPSAPRAFFGGGCGCLIIYGVLAVLGLLLGGHVQLNLLGILIGVLLAGVGGLVWRWSLKSYCRRAHDRGYWRGYEDGVDEGQAAGRREALKRQVPRS